MIDTDRIASAKAALDDMDDFARMDTGINPIGARTYLETFIADVEAQTMTADDLNLIRATATSIRHNGMPDLAERLDGLLTRLKGDA